MFFFYNNIIYVNEVDFKEKISNIVFILKGIKVYLVINIIFDE